MASNFPVLNMVTEGHITLFMDFYKNMGEDKYKLFTYEYFNVHTPNVDHSEFLKQHFFTKLVNKGVIKQTSVELNGFPAFTVNKDLAEIIEAIVLEVILAKNGGN